MIIQYIRRLCIFSLIFLAGCSGGDLEVQQNKQILDWAVNQVKTQATNQTSQALAQASQLTNQASDQANQALGQAQIIFEEQTQKLATHTSGLMAHGEEIISKQGTSVTYLSDQLVALLQQSQTSTQETNQWQGCREQLTLYLSPECRFSQTQIQRLGDIADQITIINCAEQTQACAMAGITITPTRIDAQNNVYEWLHRINELSEKTWCKPDPN